jgi:Eukaryotic-type carbonic anhydrase.
MSPPSLFPVALSGVWNAKETPCISGGPLLNDVYVFDKLIFKWGGCDHTGSEHATDSKFYPLERQMIFRRDSNSVFSIVEPRKRCNNPECRVKDCNDLHEDMLSAVSNESENRTTSHTRRWLIKCTSASYHQSMEKNLTKRKSRILNLDELDRNMLL